MDRSKPPGSGDQDDPGDVQKDVAKRAIMAPLYFFENNKQGNQSSTTRGSQRGRRCMIAYTLTEARPHTTLLRALRNPFRI